MSKNKIYGNNQTKQDCAAHSERAERDVPGTDTRYAWRNNVKSIRYELGKRVRYQLRIIPELKFFVDDSLDYAAHIDELLKK